MKMSTQEIVNFLKNDVTDGQFAEVMLFLTKETMPQMYDTDEVIADMDVKQVCDNFKDILIEIQQNVIDEKIEKNNVKLNAKVYNCYVEERMYFNILSDSEEKVNNWLNTHSINDVIKSGQETVEYDDRIVSVEDNDGTANIAIDLTKK